MFRGQYIRLALLGGLVFAVTLVGCNQVPPVPELPPPQVTVALPVQKAVSEYHDFSGKLEAEASVEIRARVQGFLESMHFNPDIGRQDGNPDSPVNVKKGDLLFVIERAPFEARVDQAEAAVAAAKANRIEADANFKRAEDLRSRDVGAITDVQYDQLKAAAELAAAEVSAAEAELESANIDLGYTEIKSPITGRIGRNLVDVGNLVGAGEQTVLAKIVTVDPIYCYFSISERLLQQTQAEARELRKAGAENPMPTVSLGLDAEKGYSHQGVLDYISPSADSATGTFRVRGRFDNPDATMWPEMNARVRVRGELHEDVLLVDERAIVTDLGGKYLLVVADEQEIERDGKTAVEKNVVEKRLVQLGQIEGRMRVVTDGLEPTERYIVKGLQRARPGFPVDPVLETPAQEETSDKNAAQQDSDSKK